MLSRWRLRRFCFSVNWGMTYFPSRVSSPPTLRLKDHIQLLESLGFSNNLKDLNSLAKMFTASKSANCLILNLCR
ncbi:hypothetical protein SprV_0200975500 [Sparganum proliferum]